MGRYRLTREAKEDVKGVWGYIARDNQSAADRFIDKIMDAVELIADNPGIGRLRPEFGEGIRSFPAGRYLIFYKAEADAVRVGMICAGDLDLARHVRRLRWE